MYKYATYADVAHGTWPDPCAMAKAFDPQHGQHRDGDWGSHCAGSSLVTRMTRFIPNGPTRLTLPIVLYSSCMIWVKWFTSNFLGEAASSLQVDSNSLLFNLCLCRFSMIYLPFARRGWLGELASEQPARPGHFREQHLGDRGEIFTGKPGFWPLKYRDVPVFFPETNPMSEACIRICIIYIM